jgi:hypothetical protein
MKRLNFLTAIMLMVLFSCSSDDGDGGAMTSTLFSTAQELSGVNCSTGGVAISSGTDLNGNGILDIAEVQDILYVCNGLPGQDGSPGSLVIAENVVSGSDCANGGVSVTTGADTDGDGSLSSTEITSVQFVCNGTEGLDGLDGLDGVSVLVNSVIENPGVNCTSGGFRVELGQDDNKNDILDTEEIEFINYVCNGSDGVSYLVVSAVEPAGANCQEGGFRLDIGPDLNGNELLDADEIRQVRYVCNGDNGTNGTDGLTSLVSTNNIMAGGECANGGVQLNIGIDDNGDGILDAAEIDQMRVVCNGSNGLNGTTSLVLATVESAGINCVNGGIRLDIGVDDNADGTLSSDEIDQTQYVCNGENAGATREYFLQNGFKGYNAMIGATISQANPDNNNPNLFVSRSSGASPDLTRVVLLFAGVSAEVSGDFSDPAVFVNEAVLYLRVNSISNDQNTLGVGTLDSFDPTLPIFQNDVTWNDATAGIPWVNPGVYDEDFLDELTYGGFEDSFGFSGFDVFPSQWIALRLSRQTVERWILDETNNKGLILGLARDGTGFIGFDDDSNPVAEFRPMLYLNVEDDSPGGRKSYPSEEEERMRWEQMSKEERFAPLDRMLGQNQ